MSPNQQPAQDGNGSLERLDVGDHVVDINDLDADHDDEPTMVVVGISPKRADQYELEGDIPWDTVADANPDYPADDRVYEVVYPADDQIDISDVRRYPFPRTRLVREARVHSDDLHPWESYPDIVLGQCPECDQPDDDRESMIIKYDNGALECYCCGASVSPPVGGDE